MSVELRATKNRNNSIPVTAMKNLMILFRCVNILILFALLKSKGAAYVCAPLYFAVFLGFTLNNWASTFLSKHIKARLSRDQVNNSLSLIKGAFLDILCTSLFFAVSIFVFHDSLGFFLFSDVHMGVGILLCAPMVVFSAVYNTLNGAIWGWGYSKPVRVSMIIREITSFICSIAGVFICKNMGIKAAALLRNEEVLSVYEAFGALCGLLIGSFVGMLSVIFFYFLVRSQINEDCKKDTFQNIDSTQKSCLFVFRNTIIDVLIFGTVLCTPLLNYTLWIHLTKPVYEDTQIVSGLLFGFAIPFTVFLVSVAAVCTQSTFRDMRTSFKDEDYYHQKAMFTRLLIFASAPVLPVIGGLGILANPLIACFLGATDNHFDMVSIFVMSGFFMFITILVFRLLQAWRQSLPILFLAVLALVIQTSVVVSAFGAGAKGEHVIAVGVLVQFIVLFIGGMLVFRTRIVLNRRLRRVIIMGCITGLGCILFMLILNLLIPATVSAFLRLIVCFTVPFLVYLIVTCKLGFMPKEEMEHVPLGQMYIRISEQLPGGYKDE